MDFALTPAQLALRRELIAFAQAELAPGGQEPDRDDAFNVGGWRSCAAHGIFRLPVPCEYGGRGVDPLTMTFAVQALAFGCPDNGLVFAACNHLFACVAPVLTFGTPEQKARYLPGLAQGTDVGAHAMSEPSTGSDTASITTTAMPRGAGYVLNGHKAYITNGPVATVFIVFARTSGAPGAGGLSAFIVERGTPGVRVGPPIPKMGLRAAPMAEIVFEECEISERQRLGREGDGALVFALTTELERLYLSAMHVGAMARLLDRCVEYARERRQFGRPIADFQAVSHKLARIKVDVELAELMLYKIAWLHQRRQRAYFESAAIKLFTSESYVRASLAALEIHGAAGYVTRSGIERQVRDSLASPLYAGTSDIQRELIAAWLGLEARAGGSGHAPAGRQERHADLQKV